MLRMGQNDPCAKRPPASVQADEKISAFAATEGIQSKVRYGAS